jgi:uncharacterized protein YuzE
VLGRTGLLDDTDNVIIILTMQLEYDDSTDSAYLALVEGEVSRSLKLRPWLVADLDEHGRIIGLELLMASKHLDVGRVRPTVDLVGTREAAAVFDVRPSNFIRDWASRADFPPPLAELASTRVWDRAALENYRAAHVVGV